MRLTPKDPEAAATVIASRWNLKIHDFVIETSRAYIYRVDAPQGLSALKLYKKWGNSGEGAAVPFLRGLDPDIGAKIHRNSVVRAAVLMEWLDGQTLGQLITQGQDARATELIASVGQAVRNTDFWAPIIYRRVAPGLKRDFQKCLDQPDPTTPQHELRRSMALLDHIMQTSPKERVIHGDLAFDNIIVTANGPRLIDPKGFRADPAFELAKALVMPLDNLSIQDLTNRINARGSVLADAIGTTPLRLIQWAAVILAHKVIYASRRYPDQRTLKPLLTTLLDMSEH